LKNAIVPGMQRAATAALSAAREWAAGRRHSFAPTCVSDDIQVLPPAAPLRGPLLSSRSIYVSSAASPPRIKEHRIVALCVVRSPKARSVEVRRSAAERQTGRVKDQTAAVRAVDDARSAISPWPSRSFVQRLDEFERLRSSEAEVMRTRKARKAPSAKRPASVEARAGESLKPSPANIFV
jgi:hypothetical protein